jgi:hypothetical protein
MCQFVIGREISYGELQTPECQIDSPKKCLDKESTKLTHMRKLEYQKMVKLEICNRENQNMRSE